MFLKSTLVSTRRAFLGTSSVTRYLSTSQPRAALSSCKSLGLDKAWGIDNDLQVQRNLTYDEIFEKESVEGRGNPDMEWHISKNGTFSVDTGKFTGRSPKDKWIVKTPGSESAEHVWFGDINQPVDGKVFDELYESVMKHYNEDAKSMYVFDGYCGAAPATQKKVRFVTEMAWQHHFVTNMFIRPKEVPSEADFAPDFTIINACKVTNQKWKEHGLNSDVFVAFNVEKKIGIIGGTWYGGEMKKGIFGMMNYWLPLEGIMSMHCSANKGKNGDSALFFGLSGTGKTTLSADPKRLLIGDDEHGWDNDGIFNFEGGCYAKTINLREENEPEIYHAIRRNALLENCTFKADKTPDYDDISKTQNGRVSYPIEHIPNHAPDLRGDHPKVCIFLTCDAYGVLPPVSKLSPEQAMYHFLSGYTAKVAGTERGITEPTATFSACFGAAFMTLHPTKYAELLQSKLETHGTHAYLVNTGWTGGANGVGKRMSIKDTRACIDAILEGSIEETEFTSDPIFQFQVPKSLKGVDAKVLQPREAWANKDEYDATAHKLANMFVENFKQFSGPDAKVDYSPHGPIVN